MKINLTDDQINEVVLFELQRHSVLLESNVDSLKSKKKKDLRKFEKEDLAGWKEVLAAMERLVEYYGS